LVETLLIPTQNCYACSSSVLLIATVHAPGCKQVGVANSSLAKLVKSGP